MELDEADVTDDIVDVTDDIEEEDYDEAFVTVNKEEGDVESEVSIFKFGYIKQGALV